MPTPPPAPAPAITGLTMPVGVEIGFFDETDTPEEPKTIPLSRYLNELAEFMRLDVPRSNIVA